MSGFLSKLEETISRLAETTGGGKIICAVSGGPDSVAMLLMLHEAIPAIFELIAAHFDHNIREKSGRDAQWVGELAEELGLPFYSGGDDIPLRSEILRMNLEETARESRRDFLSRLLRDIGAVRVALGHTVDDQATTVLMNLARGAGADGMSGITEDDGLFLRPVIKYHKSELMDFLNDKNQPYLTDSSNEDLTLTRNRVDRVILPELRDINSGAVANIVNASDVIREQNAYLDKFINEISGEVIEEKDDSVFLAGLFLFRGLEFNTVLKKAFSLTDPTKTLEMFHYAEVARLDEGGSANLPGGIIACRKGESLRLKAVRAPSLETWHTEVSVPGESLIPDIGLKVIVTEGPAPAEFPGQKANIAWFRKEIFGDTIIVRSRRPGDFFRPSGGGGKCRIKDYFIDEKIPASKRSSIPLLEVPGEIIWVVGYRIAEGVSAVPGGESISVYIT